MASLWLTPITIQPAVTISPQRLLLELAEAADTFRGWMNGLHPRLLMLFKANLLLSEEAELACGVDELPFALDDGQQIEFGSERLELSHCAENFMDRLSSPGQCAEWLRQFPLHGAASTEPYAEWLRKMQQWYKAGFYVILLKED